MLQILLITLMPSINLSLLSASITSYNSAVHDEALTMCFIRKFKRKRLNLLTDSKEKRWVLLLLSFPRAVRAMACANHSLISSCFSSAYVEILSTWEVWRLKRLELHSAASRATLTPLSCSPNFPRAQYLDMRTLTHELIVNCSVNHCSGSFRKWISLDTLVLVRP